MDRGLALLVLLLGGVKPGGLNLGSTAPLPPFLAGLQKDAASGAWEAGGDWSRLGDLLAPCLAVKGLRPGLVNLPGPVTPPPDPAFFIGRAADGDGRPEILPTELAEDLYDYLPDPPRPAASSHSGSARGLADLAFAEQAAVARIRFEHTRRLAEQYRPGLLAVHFGGLELTRVLFGPNAGRWLVMLNQLDYYFAGLAQALAPAAVALVGGGGLLAVAGPGLGPGADLGRLGAAQAGALLASTAEKAS